MGISAIARTRAESRASGVRIYFFFSSSMSDRSSARRSDIIFSSNWSDLSELPAAVVARASMLLASSLSCADSFCISSSCFSTFICSCCTVTYFWSMPVSSDRRLDFTSSSRDTSSCFTASSSCFETPPHPIDAAHDEYDSTARSAQAIFFIRPPNRAGSPGSPRLSGSVALFFRKVLNATNSHPAGPVGRQVGLPVGDLRALDRVLGQLHAAAKHPFPFAEVDVLRGAPGVFLVPVGRPLE